MQRLYLARDRVEAQFLHDFLAEERVESVILGDFLTGAAGELPLDIFPAVWVVEDADFERAKSALERFLGEERERLDAPAWICSRCGESVDGGFERCWSCGAARSGPESVSDQDRD